MNVPGPAFLLSVSILLSANGCAQPVAVGTSAGPRDAPSDNRSRAVAAYQAANLCMTQMRQAVQAGASEVERAGIVQDCTARSRAMSAPYSERQPGGDQGLPGWVVGINYEKEGRYADAAAVYQKTLNDEGYPNGDGFAAGERLGYLYANGLGVPRDTARARQLFSASPNQQTDLALLDHGMLPRSPEGVPDAVRRMEEEDRKSAAKAEARAAEAEERARKERLANPEAAHAYDVAQCNSICSSRVSSCNRNNFLDFSGLYSGSSHQTDCASFARRCYAVCH